jgi:hypothetical protein
MGLTGIWNKAMSWSCHLTSSYLPFQIPLFRNKRSSYISRSQTVLRTTVCHAGACAACVLVLAWSFPTPGCVLSLDRKMMCSHQTSLPMMAVA